MNKRRLAEPHQKDRLPEPGKPAPAQFWACLEPQDAETLARAVNAEPWEPMPGMVKRRCLSCRYLCAVADAGAAVQQFDDLIRQKERPPGHGRRP